MSPSDGAVPTGMTEVDLEREAEAAADVFLRADAGIGEFLLPLLGAVATGLGTSITGFGFALEAALARGFAGCLGLAEAYVPEG